MGNVGGVLARLLSRPVRCAWCKADLMDRAVVRGSSRSTKAFCSVEHGEKYDDAEAW